ncbi:MAG TPA: aminotransferase class V-fold PLP-dependent enzyme [Gammaproteobacteria bacterium]
MIYLDNAATSFPKPAEVAEAMARFLAEAAANPGRGGHRMAVNAERMLDDVRVRIARLVNGSDPSRVIFTLNCTDALNIAIKGVLPDERVHVVTTVLEHNSVSRPLQGLADAGRIELTRVGCDGQGFVDPDDVRRALRPDTRLVVMTHASNVLGTIQDAGAVGAIVREHGALFCVDAAQTAGVVPIDVAALCADLIAFPGHKALLGPTGTGILYVGERCPPPGRKLGSEPAFAAEGLAEKLGSEPDFPPPTRGTMHSDPREKMASHPHGEKMGSHPQGEKTGSHPYVEKTGSDPRGGESSFDRRAGESSFDRRAGESSFDPRAGESSSDPRAGESSSDPRAGKSSFDPRLGKSSFDPRTGKSGSDPNFSAGGGKGSDPNFRPWREGGTGGDSSSPTQPPVYPHYLEGGTPNTVGIAGLGAALDFVLARGPDAALAHERRLLERILAHVDGDERITVYGPRDTARRVGALSINIAGLDPNDAAAILDDAFGIAVRAGLHCAPYCHRAIGTFPAGTLRISPGPFTTDDDLAALLDALDQVAEAGM